MKQGLCRACAAVAFVAMLSACAPSSQTIQTAIANTQSAFPTLAAPVSTIVPSRTAIACTDRGWQEIELYLHQFTKQRTEITVGMSKSGFLQSLENSRTKISQMEVDPCAEHAKQKILSGMATEIYGYTSFLTTGDKSAMESAGVGEDYIRESIAELKGLDIEVKYP